MKKVLKKGCFRFQECVCVMFGRPLKGPGPFEMCVCVDAFTKMQVTKCIILVAMHIGQLGLDRVDTNQLM